MAPVQARTLMVAVAVLCFFGMTDAIALSACPTHEEVFDLKEKPENHERIRRHYLLCACGVIQNDGNHAIADKDKAKTYLLLVNDDFLARYDANCSGDLETPERQAYLFDQEKALDKKIEKAKKSAEKLAAHSLKRWNRQTVHNGYPISEDAALEVLTKTKPKTNKVSLSYTLSVDDAQDTENAKFGFSFQETPRFSLSAKTQLATAWSFDFGWKEVETTEFNTITKAVDFLPLSFSYTPTENLTFSASAGLGYLETSKLEFATGVEDDSDDIAYSYKFGFSYKVLKECLAIGTDYKIRTERWTSDKLSYEWLPTITFDLLKCAELDSS